MRSSEISILSPDMQKERDLDFHALDNFGPDELDYRHRLLFELSRLIWES